MRKGSILMLAYSFALIAIVIVDTIVKQGITTKIAIAAALSCYLFAFADMFSIRAERMEGEVVKNQLRVELLNDVLDNSKRYIQFWRSKYEKLEKNVRSFDINGEVEQFLDNIEKGRNAIEDIESGCKELDDGKKELEEIAKKNEKAKSRYIAISLVLLFLGFVLFFLVAFFDVLSKNFEPVQNAISICAFAVVIQCYEYKDSNRTAIEEDERANKSAKDRVDQLRQTFQKTMDATGLDTLYNSLVEQIDSKDNQDNKNKGSDSKIEEETENG